MVPRSASEEGVHDGPMRIVVATVPARRPPNGLELVVVAAPNNVAACVGQPLRDIEVTGGRGLGNGQRNGDSSLARLGPGPAHQGQQPRERIERIKRITTDTLVRPTTHPRGTPRAVMVTSVPNRSVPIRPIRSIRARQLPLADCSPAIQISKSVHQSSLGSC